MSNILLDVGIDYNCSWEYVKNWLLDARLREPAEADKDGRVVVLPCKAGTPVWRITHTFETYPDENEQYVRNDTFFLSDLPSFGETVFLSREEAEKALEERRSEK